VHRYFARALSGARTALLALSTLTCVGPPSEVAPPAPNADWLAAAQSDIAARAYGASRSGERWQAPNRDHALRTYFEREGVRVVDRVAPGSPELAGLRLARWGRGGAALAPAQPGDVLSDAARVEIRRPGLTEWYLNSPAGLEQGFALAERPAGSGDLVLELAVAPGSARLAGDAVQIDTPTGRTLRFVKLFARPMPRAPTYRRASPCRLPIACSS
jgi:hypothetical protein